MVQSALHSGSQKYSTGVPYSQPPEVQLCEENATEQEKRGRHLNARRRENGDFAGLGILLMGVKWIKMTVKISSEEGKPQQKDFECVKDSVVTPCQSV